MSSIEKLYDHYQSSLYQMAELLSFYISRSNLTADDLKQISLSHKDGREFKVSSVELRKNQPTILKMVDGNNKQSFFNSDSLSTGIFESIDIADELKAKLTNFRDATLAEENRIKKEKEERELEYLRNKRKIMRDEGIEKHRRLLEKNKVNYKGYRKENAIWDTHCYFCQNKLSTKTHYVCNTCNRIICYCGHCLCASPVFY